MQSEVPRWILVAQALATPALALLGLAIAWAQWRTSRSKLVLDLHEQRMGIYRSLRTIVAPVVSEATATPDTIRKYSTVQAEARFLFGRDVTDYLQSMREALSKLNYYHRMREAKIPAAERETNIVREHELLERASKFDENLAALMEPYARMHHKLP